MHTRKPHTVFSSPGPAVAALACLLLALPGGAAVDIDSLMRWGAPRIERYVPKTTFLNDPAQQITMLPGGEIAFISKSQFIVFNGTQWTTLPKVGPRAQLAAMDGKAMVVHSGGVDWIAPDTLGSYTLEALSGPVVHPESSNLTEGVATARGHVFASHGSFLVVTAPDGSSQIHDLEVWASSIFGIGEEIYVTGGGTALLNRWDWDARELVDCQDVLYPTEYIWLTSAQERSEGGVWLLNQDNRIIGFDGEKTWFWKGNDEIATRGAVVQCFEELAPGELAIGTNASGVLVFDQEGKLVQQITKDHGIDDENVIAIGADSQNGLWISTARSVTRTQLDPNILVFDERHGITDPVDAIEIFNGRLHLATANGIYTNNPAARAMAESFVLKYPSSGVSALLAHQNKLFVAGPTLSVIDQDEQRTVLHPESTTLLWQPSEHPDLVLSGNYRGILGTRFSQGKWSPAKYLEGPQREVFTIAESDDGTLIGSMGGQDYAKILIQGDLGTVEIRSIPADMEGMWSIIAEVEGHLYFNSKPCLRWDSGKDAFVPDDGMGYFRGQPPFGFNHVLARSNDEKWVTVNGRQGNTVRSPNREVVSFVSSINNSAGTQASAIAYDRGGRAWIGGSFGLVLAPKPHAAPPQYPTASSIHRLVSLTDGVRLPTVAGPDGTLQLEPHQNSLRIEAAFQQFLENSQNQFQIFVEGLDARWPAFSATSFREVTHLPPGRYNLIVNARNHQGQAFTYTLPLLVQTPLYLRAPAIAAYLAAALLFIVGLVYSYNRQQIRKSRRLQQLVTERTREIASKNAELETQAQRLETQNEELEEKTEELTATTETLTSTLSQLHEMQDQLVATARTAGKAEIAINVLHSVGNVLNSLNVSVNVLSQKAQNSNATKLTRLAALVEQHRENIAAFMADDPRGKSVPTYLVQLAKALEEEVATTLHELGVMNEDIDHIKNVIAAQQTHAKSDSIVEDVAMRELCENALNIVGDERSASQIEVINEVPADLVVENDKHRLLDILLNLLSNAIDAIDEQKPEIGVLTLRARTLEGSQNVEFSVTDNGVGIASEDQEKLFRHGFTTKANGHGFGLHSCANAAKVLGGQLTLTSPGKGRGATAALTLPRAFTPRARPTQP